MRLILPFVITMLFLCAWGSLQAVLKHDWTMALRHPLSLLWASGDEIDSERFGLILAGPMWFLLALFWMREVFYYGAGWILAKAKKWGDEIVVGCSFVVSVLAMLIHPLVEPLPWSVLQGLASIEFYAIGWYANRHKIPMWAKAMCIICWPLAIRYGGLELESGAYHCYPLDVFGACGAVMVLYYVFDWISKKIMQVWPKIYAEYQTPLQWLGVNSLAVLCMHTLEMYSGFLFSILCRLPFEISGGWLVTLRMTVAIALAWVILHVPGLKKVYGK